MENKNKKLMFEDLSQEEKAKRGILGRLYGPCASISIPTRNGRFYSKSIGNCGYRDINSKANSGNVSHVAIEM
jgi:hypothetical protein